jgi:two-component system chemotaxis response regulator CheB
MQHTPIDRDHRLVVIGASTGGFEPLRILMRGLGSDFPASLMVVVHMSADSPGVLADILERAGELPATMVASATRLLKGHIYVAAPDHHLVVEDGLALAAHGPKENRFRPAVDPLFRSAAASYGPRVVGVVLSGNLDDGVAGLHAIKQRGGTAVVQDPDDAIAKSMPLNAMRQVEVDHCVPVAQMAPLLQQLVRAPIAQTAVSVPRSMQMEIDVASGHVPEIPGSLRLGEPSTFACPECHGVLFEIKEGELRRFRCHTGHAYSRATLLASLDERVEDSLWNAARGLQEKAQLARVLANDAGAGERGERDELLARAVEAERRAERVRAAIARHIEETSPPPSGTA